MGRPPSCQIPAGKYVLLCLCRSFPWLIPSLVQVNGRQRCSARRCSHLQPLPADEHDEASSLCRGTAHHHSRLVSSQPQDFARPRTLDLILSPRYISAICLLSLNATAAGPLQQGLERPPSEYIWSQAFYYGIWAAILYFVDASLMTVTFWGASSGHYSKDFALTTSQRTLMLQTIVFLMYLLIGALVFSVIEDWKFLDAVYWADVTLFTVGLGDKTPSTTLGRALLLPYSIVGIISLGLVITAIRGLMLERGKHRLEARVEEKSRRKKIVSLTRRGLDDVLTPVVSAANGDNDASSPQELIRREAEFALMRRIQDQALSRQRWLAMLSSAAVWLLLWLIGALIFLKCEQRYQSWSYFTSFYFSFTSLFTIGYGDFTPVSNAGKSFFVFWSLLALPTMTVLISQSENTVLKFFRNVTLRLGNITILPDDGGYTGSIKHVVYRITCGLVFVEHGTHQWSQQKHNSMEGDGSFGSARWRHRDESSGGNDGDAAKLSDPSTRISQAGDDAASNPTTARPPTTSSLGHICDRLEKLPTGHEYRLVLISEIEALTKQLRKPKPRRYTFAEWAWYLGLLGEDERDANNHKKATPRKHHKRRPRRRRRRHHRMRGVFGRTPPTRSPHASPPRLPEEPRGSASDGYKWSWVGDWSPLAGGYEETEWILDGLMSRLRQSLAREEERDRGWHRTQGRTRGKCECRRRAGEAAAGPGTMKSPGLAIV